MSTEQETQQTSAQNPSKKVKISADLIKSTFFFITKNARKQKGKYKLSRHQKQTKPITWTGSFIALRYWPSGETSATEFNKFSRGMRTLSNLENKNATWVWCFNYAIKKKCLASKRKISSSITRYDHCRHHSGQSDDHNQQCVYLDRCFHHHPWFVQ